MAGITDLLPAKHLLSGDTADLLTGRVLSSEDDQKAKDYLAKSAGAFDNLAAPTLSPVDLKKYAWQGDLTPSTISAGADVQYDPTQAHLADAGLAGPSAMGDVNTDPRLKDQQLASLSALQDLATHGGMNATDQANLNRIQSQAAQADRGRRDAILQNMSARGMGGGGNELLSQLQSSQAATDRQSQQGLDIAGMAQQRALDAMMRGGDLAGQVRGQDFGEQAAKAQSADAISKFNASQRGQTNQYNAGATTANDQFNAGNKLRTGIYNRDTDLGVSRFNAGQTQGAAQYSQAGRQGIANANVDQTNKGTMYNSTLPQQDFANKYQIAGGKSGAAKTGMDYYGKQSDQDRQAYKDLVSGGLKAATPVPGAWTGEIIPGKAPVPGDHPANDIVLRKVSPGEAILPRSVVSDLLRTVQSKSGGDAEKGSRATNPFDIEGFLSTLGHSKEKGGSAPSSPHLAALKFLVKKAGG